MTEPTASPADTTRAGPAQSRRGGLARWAFGIFLLAAVIGAVLHFGDIEEFATLARSAKPEWMLLALLAQAGTYVAAGAIWRAALKRAGHPQPLASLAALGLVKLFADQALPIGGVSGVIVLMRGLARRDIPPRITMAALLVDMVTYYGAYLAVVLVAVAILIVNREANAIILVGAAVFAIMVVAVPGAVLWLRRLGRLPLPAWSRRFPRTVSLVKSLVDAPSDLLRDPGLIARVAALQVVIFLLDALTLWLSFQALGSAPPLWVSFVAFVIASAAATISVIPLGLGSFEAASVMVLNLLGVSLGRGLTATLLLRVLTFWLPMIPGLILTRRELRD